MPSKTVVKEVANAIRYGPKAEREGLWAELKRGALDGLVKKEMTLWGGVNPTIEQTVGILCRILDKKQIAFSLSKSDRTNSYYITSFGRTDEIKIRVSDHHSHGRHFNILTDARPNIYELCLLKAICEIGKLTQSA